MYRYYFSIAAACVVNTLSARVIEANEEQSSPSSINATKGSSVSLHWNYSYIGDGVHNNNVHISITYKEQVVVQNSTSNPYMQVLAKRIGQHGALALESPVPTPFTGRVEVISSNSTLAIHRIQYNDSTYQFSSKVTVDVDFGAGPKSSVFELKPVVSITVYGMRYAFHSNCLIDSANPRE